MEGGLEELMVFKRRLEADAQALRQQMTVMCLATVADLAHGGLVKACLVEKIMRCERSFA